jgi:hypothetical protein
MPLPSARFVLPIVTVFWLLVALAAWSGFVG